MKLRRVVAGSGTPVDEAVDPKRPSSPPGAPVLFYRAALPWSSRTLTFAAGIIRRHRAAIGSRWRKLNAGQQALLVLAHLLIRRDVRRARRRVRGRHGHGVEIRERDCRAARGPGAEAPQGGPGREEGRIRLRRRGRGPWSPSTGSPRTVR